MKTSNTTETTGSTQAADATITVMNDLQQADIWILPETPENLKTTLWGTATAAKVATGESRQAPLCAPGEGGTYLLRMIDTDSFYYSAGGITLEAGCTLHIKGEDMQNITAEVSNQSGALIGSYEVFAARL